MDDYAQYQRVLAVFAHYGFRKASMAELAEAAGVSRQTLYNRLRDKEAVLDWAVLGMAELAHQRAEESLYSARSGVREALVDGFTRKMGDFVPMLHESPHGWEIMDRGIDSLARANVDTEARFEQTIAQYLLERGVVADINAATDVTFVLVVAAKGLMIRCATAESFRLEMERVVRVVVPSTASALTT